MREKTLIVLAALLALVVVNLPFAYFFLSNNVNYFFLGRHMVNGEDAYTYVSFIEQARQGRSLFENLYTSEAQVPSLFRPSYLIIGKAAALLNISSIAAFHTSRIVLMIIFFIVLYKFLRKFFKSPKERILAFFIVLFSAGISSFSAIPEANTFLSLGEPPHFILSQILILSGFYFFIEFLETRKNKYIPIFSIIFLLLSFEHPFDILVISPTILLSDLWSGGNIFEALTLTGFSSVGLLYQFYEASRNQIFKSWYSQNILISPSLHDLLSGFGLLLPLSLVGIEKFFKKLEVGRKLLLVWLFVGLVLIYSPMIFQRRLIEGVHIPLSILAIYGILWVCKKVKMNAYVVTIVLLSVLSYMSFLSIYNDFVIFNHPLNHYYYFIDKDELAAINYLGSITSFNDIIFANKNYGNLIPGLIGRKVYLGHSIQTINLSEKINLANDFLLDNSFSSSLSFLVNNKITYIFLGKDDAMVKYGFNPSARYYLVNVYSKNGVNIYKFEEKPGLYFVK